MTHIKVFIMTILNSHAIKFICILFLCHTKTCIIGNDLDVCFWVLILCIAFGCQLGQVVIVGSTRLRLTWNLIHLINMSDLLTCTWPTCEFVNPPNLFTINFEGLAFTVIRIESTAYFRESKHVTTVPLEYFTCWNL